MYWNQKDQAVLELDGQAAKLFLPWVISAQQTYQQNPDVFGTVEDLAAHKARLAELEARRTELHGRFPSRWAHDDLHSGRSPVTARRSSPSPRHRTRCRCTRPRLRGSG